MLKNLVFDMGGVIVDWNPQKEMKEKGLSEEDISLVSKYCFGTPQWSLLDWGMITCEEMEKIACSKLPSHLHSIIHYFLFDWGTELKPIPGMEALVRKYKAQGLGIYMLSNASVKWHYYSHFIPCLDCFEGWVISADVKQIKPNPEIFRTLLDKFSLNASECLFIDDMSINVAGAIVAGMNAVRFDGNSENLDDYIKSLLQNA